VLAADTPLRSLALRTCAGAAQEDFVMGAHLASARCQKKVSMILFGFATYVYTLAEIVAPT
jgi:hypothetical protein